MASIEERNGGFRVRWRGLDGRPRSRQCPDRKTAREVKAAVERAVARGEDWPPADTGGGGATLAVIVADYLADCRRRGLAPGTLKNVEGTLGQLIGWLSEGGPAMPGDLTQQAVRRWHASQIGAVDVRTAALKLGRVLVFWRWAWESEAWESDVPRFRTVDPGAVPPPRRIPAPTLAQVDEAIMHVGERAEWMRRAMLIQRYTGIRSGQARRLEWADVDLDAGRLVIRPELGKTNAERRGRTVPLHPGLIAELAGWGRREGMICGAPRCPDTTGTSRRAWARAGVEVRQPLHGIRHAVASHLRASGVAEDVIGVLLGHAQTVTGAHYVDPVSMWPALVAAVALIPRVGVPDVSRLDDERRKAAKSNV